MSSRSAIRINRRDFYVRVDTATARDEEMSYRALGLLTHILSHTDEWAVRSEQLSRPKGREGRDAVRKGLHELARRGHYRLERRRFRDGKVVMGTAVSEYRVEQWASDYETFGNELTIDVVEQEDGTFLVRYPDNTLGHDGFGPGATVEASSPETPQPQPAARPEPAVTAVSAKPPTAKAAGPAAPPQPAPARRARPKKTAAAKSPEDQELDDAAEKVAKWWWDHAKTYLGPYVGAKGGYIGLRKQIRNALAADYTQKQCGLALQQAGQHWPSAQQWQNALSVVAKGQPGRRTGRIAYSDSATWGTTDDTTTGPSDPADAPVFDVLTD
ncbi:hypothetical protein AB0O57_29490 [Streptomyces sp. NPDC091201]|uniref:hypothetical protein n=1 Tax=Streptomyces sp. NPDC091201 TaxID=3155190 RepID=UPI003445FF28